MSRTPAPRRVGEQAVVVGASMAGLCAARVLADRFDRVVVIDRDTFPDRPGEPRRLVPQGRHPHLLHVAGARLLEGWFPGLLSELYEGGAVELDLVADFYWHQAGGAARRPPSDLIGPAMSRPYLEATVRARIGELPNVELRGDRAAIGLRFSDRQVTGVFTTASDAGGAHTDDGDDGDVVDDGDDGDAVDADIVVDATGRRARTLPWVEAAGFPAPPVDVVEVDTRYVTTTYRRRADTGRDWKAAAVIDAPASKRLAMALPVEGDRWLVMLGGLNGEAPPVDEAARLAWASSLPSPVIADLMDDSESVGDTVTHRFPSNHRRRVDRLRRFPEGWVLLGDAVCSLDPIYGQGMTSAALQADALASCLDRTGAVDRRFARRYFKAVAKVVAAPWSVAVGGDFVYPDTTGPKPPGTDLVNRYMERVTIAAQHDDEVVLRFNEVAAMVRRPESLLAPFFVLRVLRRSSRAPASATANHRDRDLSRPPSG